MLHWQLTEISTKIKLNFNKLIKMIDFLIGLVNNNNTIQTQFIYSLLMQCFILIIAVLLYIVQVAV